MALTKGATGPTALTALTLLSPSSHHSAPRSQAPGWASLTSTPSHPHTHTCTMRTLSPLQPSQLGKACLQHGGLGLELPEGLICPPPLQTSECLRLGVLRAWGGCSSREQSNGFSTKHSFLFFLAQKAGFSNQWGERSGLRMAPSETESACRGLQGLAAGTQRAQSTDPAAGLSPSCLQRSVSGLGSRKVKATP